MRNEHEENRGRRDCPSCGNTDTHLFHTIPRIPVNSVLNIFSQEEARSFPRGGISLRHCRGCGFIFNSAYEPDLVRYSSFCEESQGYSPTFNAFARKLAAGWIDKYNLRGKRIIEIGCGKGEFLKLLCKLGGNTGIGFDPAYVPGRGDEGERKGVEFITDYYGEKYSGYRGDVICCRMTLEHIFDPSGMIETVRRSIGDRYSTLVLFQVPDVTRILRNCAFEDIYYEHCSYFSPGSLGRLFRSHRFDLLDLEKTFDDQYILIEAKPAEKKTFMQLSPENDLAELECLVNAFQGQIDTAIKYWQDLLAGIGKNGRRAVIWGSGSKGVAFLSTLKNSDLIEYAVDINPHRQGTFMAGTGQQIVSPEFLKSYPPGVVIVMNPIYIDEISGDLKRMGLAPEIHALGGQSSGK
jgi:SAM-dependent methyltransferase